MDDKAKIAELLALARSSFHQARISLTEKGREALNRMGREYLAQAKRLDPTIDISRVDDRRPPQLAAAFIFEADSVLRTGLATPQRAEAEEAQLTPIPVAPQIAQRFFFVGRGARKMSMANDNFA
jgi:hypothetical protein